MQKILPEKSGDETSNGIRRTNGVAGTLVLLFAYMANIAAIPYAISKSGYLVSILFILYGGIVSYINGWYVCDMCARDQSLTTFAAVGRKAFGTAGAYFTVGFQLFLFVLAVIPLFNALAQQTQNLTQYACEIDYMYAYLVLFCIIAIMPLMREIKFMAYFSVVSAVICAIIIIANSILDKHDPQFCPETVGQQGEVTLENAFAGIGMFSLAFAASGGLPEIISEMKEPSKAKLSWGINVLFALSVYAVVGFVGNWAYGSLVNPLIFLPPMRNNWMAKVGLGLQLYSYVVATTIMINIVVVKIEMLLGVHPETWWSPKKLGVIPPVLSRFIIRSSYIAILWTVGLALPFFGPFQSLVGGLTCTPLALFIPAVYHMKIYWEEYNLFRKALVGFYVVVGMGLTCLATYMAIQSIVSATEGTQHYFELPCKAQEALECTLN